MYVDVVINDFQKFKSYLVQNTINHKFLSHLPKPLPQRGVTCGYYSLGYATRFWNEVNPHYPSYSARKKDNKVKSSQSLRQLGKKYNKNNIGAIFDVHNFQPLADEIGYEATIQTFQTEPEFAKMVMNAIDKDTPIIFPMDSSQDTWNGMVDKVNGNRAHYVTIVGYVVNGPRVDFISASHGRYYSTSSQLLFDSCNNLREYPDRTYVKEEKGKPWVRVTKGTPFVATKMYVERKQDLKHLKNHMVLIQPKELVTNDLKEEENSSIEPLKEDELIYYAIQHGHHHLIEKYFYDKNIHDFYLSCSQHKGLLHTAARFNNIEAMKFFLERGADLNQIIVGSECDSPLNIAVRANQIESIKFLLSKGADQYNKRGLVHKNYSTPLHTAAKFDRVDALKLLISAGSEINTRDLQGRSLLHIAAAFNHSNIIKVGIVSGIDINMTDLNGETALTTAIKEGQMDAFKMLLENGADVEKYFPLDNKLKIDIRERSLTPLQAAAKCNRTEMIELLLNKGANINGGIPSPLHYAIKSNNFKVVELLLKHGADLNMPNEEGLTALEHAQKYKNDKISSLVLSFLTQQQEYLTSIVRTNSPYRRFSQG